MRVFAGLASLAAVAFAQDDSPVLCVDQCQTLGDACRARLPGGASQDLVQQCVGVTLSTQFAGVQHDCRDCIELQYGQVSNTGTDGGWGDSGDAIDCFAQCNPQRLACEANGFIGMQVQGCVRGMLDKERQALQARGGTPTQCLTCVTAQYPGGGTNVGLKDCLNVSKIMYEERPKGKSQKYKGNDLCDCQDQCNLLGGWGCSYKPHKKVGRKGKCNCFTRKSGRPRNLKMKRYRGGSSVVFDNVK